MPRRLNIIQVLPALESGGVERGTLEVARYLVAQGHRSIVISAGGRLVETLLAQGSEHLSWSIGSKSLLTLKYIPRLIKFIQDNKIDILHVRSRFPAWLCYLAWKKMPVSQRPRLITTVHGQYSVSPYSRIMTRGERVIVVSEMIRNYVLQHYPVDPKRLWLNYRGVDPAHFYHGYQPQQRWLQDWYRDYPQTRGKQLLTLPGRISRWKGQLDFIEALAEIRQHQSNVHGLIVGETKTGKAHFQRELEQRIAQLGLEEHITLTGHRSDIREVMAISTLVMSLSQQPEAFGRTTLEALSLGVPVIAYNHGGVAEQMKVILPEGLVEPADQHQLLARSLAWLDSRPRLQKTHPFQLQNMLDTTMAVYQDVLSEPLAV